MLDAGVGEVSPCETAQHPAADLAAWLNELRPLDIGQVGPGVLAELARLTLRAARQSDRHHRRQEGDRECDQGGQVEGLLVAMGEANIPADKGPRRVDACGPNVDEAQAERARIVEGRRDLLGGDGQRQQDGHPSQRKHDRKPFRRCHEDNPSFKDRG